MLYQNDAFGEDLLNGFKEATEGSGIKVVAEESYEVTDPTVSSQVSKLASSDADTFLNITTPKFGARRSSRPTSSAGRCSTSSTTWRRPSCWC